MDIEKINFKHTIPVQIRFNDLDVFAHVNNAVIQEYFDLAQGNIHWRRGSAGFPTITFLTLITIRP